MSDLAEIKTLVEKTGEAFDAFKKSNEENLKKRDVIIEEKMTRIEKDLDAAVEGKAALERALAAEKKEREELELRIQRAGKSIENGDRLELEVKAFNVELAANAAERKQRHEDLSVDGYQAYQAAYKNWMRKDSRL
ncbi:MAG TPA: hypothetical protein PLC79_07100, partial [Phycisphaerae bacterium]|nr:hypothetical protein [Phycisphaerae bacterium]